MKLKKIIRFETLGGIGMYYGSVSRCTDLMQESMRHPVPEDDEKLCAAIALKGLPSICSEEMYYGFGSKRQARFWVYKTSWLRGLHADGVVVAEYMCKPSDVAVGDTQAMFKSHESKQQFSILGYFKIKA